MPKASEIDYEALFALMPGALMVVDTDDPAFTIVAENQAHADVAMMPLNQAVGKPFLEAYPDTSATYRKTGVSGVIESFRKVIASNQPDRMEVLRYDLRAPDGSMERRYWRATHYPVAASDGRPRYILQSTANVTDEVLTGRKLDEAQRQLDEALAIGLIGTWLWDLKEDYVVADKNLMRMFGLNPEDAPKGLPLQDFTDAIHPDDRPGVLSVIEKTVKKKTSFEQEYRTITRQGDLRWVIARGRVELDDDGRPARFPGVIVDITERKISEQNLRYLAEVSAVLASSLDYRQTLSSIAELAIPELADWCTIDLMQDGELKLAGLAHKDPEKISWARQLREQRSSQQDNNGVMEVIRTGKPAFYPVITEEMLKAMTPDKQQLELVLSLKLTSVIIVPLISNGKPVGALTLISSELRRHYTPEDLRIAEEVAYRASLAMTNANLYGMAQEEIAARASLEERLREANERLEERVQQRTAQLQETNRSLERSNQELQDFAYVASHDLQEPLRKIQAFGNLLQEEFGEGLGEGKDYLDRMRNAASRMSVLIEDLLAFSRVTTKANPPVPVDMTVIAKEVLEDLEVRVEDCGGKVTVGTLPTVLADALQMRQLLQNLIGNALKFQQPGLPPKVTLSATVNRKLGSCTIAVADNGIGFDEKYLDRIFSVFQRLHGKDAYQGTGIGLAICRKIVERHGGTITATSQPGKGATFIVSLPLATATKPDSTARRQKPKVSSHKEGNT